VSIVLVPQIEELPVDLGCCLLPLGQLRWLCLARFGSGGQAALDECGLGFRQPCPRRVSESWVGIAARSRLQFGQELGYFCVVPAHLPDVFVGKCDTRVGAQCSFGQCVAAGDCFDGVDEPGGQSQRGDDLGVRRSTLGQPGANGEHVEQAGVVRIGLGGGKRVSVGFLADLR